MGYFLPASKRLVMAEFFMDFLPDEHLHRQVTNYIPEVTSAEMLLSVASRDEVNWNWLGPLTMEILSYRFLFCLPPKCNGEVYCFPRRQLIFSFDRRVKYHSKGL